MDIVKENQIREAFRLVLLDLAKSQDLLRSQSEEDKFYQRFESIYFAESENEAFRHFYSDIFSVLAMIQSDEQLGSIDILGQNLAKLRADYPAKPVNADSNQGGVAANIKKLYDHVSLDIARMRYSDAGDHKLSQEESIRSLASQVNDLQRDMEIARELETRLKVTTQNIDSVKEKLHSAQKEYIAILGVFAAIVLAFTGSIVFSTSVLANMHNSSVYRIILVTALIGLVLVNILYGLFYYIDRLVMGKNDKRMRPLVIANAVLILIMLATSVAWYHGAVEERNAKIESKTENVLTSTSQELQTPARIKID